MTRFSIVSALAAGISLSALLIAAQPGRAEEAAAIVKQPGEITFSGLAGAPQTAVLYGDPTKAALYVSRTKFPAGFQAMPTRGAKLLKSRFIRPLVVPSRFAGELRCPVTGSISGLMVDHSSVPVYLPLVGSRRTQRLPSLSVSSYGGFWYSYRMPRLTVSLLLTRQSSWK